MSDENEVLETDLTAAATPVETVPDVEEERKRMPPIESRFLYVDVAARRAKQLRRGALPRLKGLTPDPETGIRPESAHKLERIAMEEVDDGLVVYELPGTKAAAKEES
jgi:DNA-directed RNA polymerase omega subunit